VGFGQHGNPGDASIGGEVVQVNVKQGGAALVDTLPQRFLHPLQIIQMPGAPKVQKQVSAGILNAVPLNKVVGAFTILAWVMVFRPTLPGNG
jgi:hypothetical protein